MRCAFFIYGHPHILSEHKNTLEFTKESAVTKKGDCIVGVGATFSVEELKQLVKNYKQLTLTIQAGKLKEQIGFESNPDFNDDKELVIRMSKFHSERTFGFKTDKAAIDLDKQLVKKLQDPKTKATVVIEPKTKMFIFDFDDTLEDFKICFEYANKKLAKFIEETYDIPDKAAYQVLVDIDRYYSLKGAGSTNKMFDRHLWIKEFSKRTKINFSKKETDLIVNKYWEYVLESAKPLPHASTLLKFLKKRYLLAIMSDSDGDINIKIKRIKKVGLYDFFDDIITSDITKQNKPSKKYYQMLFKKFKLKPEECVMVGDKPEVDLKLAKEIGMTTIYVKHGVWSEYEPNAKFDYVDHTVTDLKEIIEIVRDNL